MAQAVKFKRISQKPKGEKSSEVPKQEISRLREKIDNILKNNPAGAAKAALIVESMLKKK